MYRLLAIAFFLLASNSNAETKATLILNWKAEPEFGGFYAAELGGHFKKQGLTVDIQQGGVGTPVVQMVAAGRAEFGIANAEEVIMSRDRGSDLVALFAVYQKSPKGYLVQETRGVKTLKDAFSSGILATQQGSTHFSFLKSKFGKIAAKVVPQQGGISQIASDANVTSECFVTSEPIAAEKMGLKVKSFLVADLGFNPYYTLVVTRKSFLDKNAKTVEAFVSAITRGWEDYLADPATANKEMFRLNPTIDMPTLSQIAEVQKAFILSDETKKSGVGSMNEPRWKELADQLKTLKLVQRVEPARSYYR